MIKLVDFLIDSGHSFPFLSSGQLSPSFAFMCDDGQSMPHRLATLQEFFKDVDFRDSLPPFLQPHSQLFITLFGIGQRPPSLLSRGTAGAKTKESFVGWMASYSAAVLCLFHGPFSPLFFIGLFSILPIIFSSIFFGWICEKFLIFWHIFDHFIPF